MIKNLVHIIKRQPQPWLVFLLIIVYSLIIWWPTRNLPYYWDGAMFINKAVQVMIQRNFDPLVPAFQDFAHPPLFWFFIALIQKFISNSLLAVHLFIFPFLPAYLLLTYLLAQKIFSKPLLSFSATALVGLTPFLVAEYGQIYLDLPLAVLVLGALSAQVYRHLKLASLLLVLAVLTKLTALIVVPVLVYLIWNQASKRRAWGETLLVVGPAAAAVILWLFYHHQYTNWWLVHPDRDSYAPNSLDQFLANLKQISFALFIDQNRWLLTALGAAGLFKQAQKWHTTPVSTAYIIGSAMLILTFSLMGELIYRYFLPLFPLVIISLVYFAQSLFRDSKRLGLLLIGFSFFFFQAWYPAPNSQVAQSYRITQPNDLTYQDQIALGIETTQYIKTHFNNPLVYGAIPENYQLSEPFQGYVTTPVDFNYCHYYQPQPDRTVLIFHHLYSPLQPACQQLLTQVRTKPIKRFEQNGFWVNIYQVQYE